MHPPELDELGLVAAIRDYVLEADGEGLSTGLQLTVHRPAGGLPPLGAAVEVAAQVFLELTAREREVLELIAQGFSNHKIAERLVISPKTVRNYITSIFSKLRVADRTSFVLGMRGWDDCTYTIGA